METSATTYAQSGVNREAADKLVERISVLAKSTLNKRVKAAVGGYASLYELDRKRWLAASTDGVGTKLKLAFHLRNHRTIGIDLVAMSVNDLLCVGAEPLFFLDYFATGKLEPGIAEQVLEGIVEGCRQSAAALVGGETAEMPDFYQPGEYDLGGFAVGVVDPRHVLPRKTIKPGDAILGIASSGCHSNGYSLLRKLLSRALPIERNKLAEQLLTPTKIYAKSLGPLIRQGKLKGLAHITGSGFLNVPRMSEKVCYEIELPSQAERPEIYKWVGEASGLPFDELARTFNLGIGMVVVCEARHADATLKALRRKGETTWKIGQVVRRGSGQPCQVALRDASHSATLTY